LNAPAPSRLPIIRVKLPCKDEPEFQARLAPNIASKGVFVSPPTLLAIGSHLKVKLEFAGGAVGVSGEAVVVKHLPSGKRTGMTLHLVHLDADSVQFPLRPLPGTAPPAPAPAPPPKKKTDPRLTAAALFDDNSSDLLLQLRAPPPPAPPSPAVRPAPAPALASVIVAQETAPAPARDAAPIEDNATVARKKPSRKTLVIAAICVVIVAAGAGLGYFFGTERKDDSALNAKIALADQRLAAGRLAGPGGDEALDHLLAAKVLKADDARVKERLTALADKFEQLGDMALTRGDSAEAAAHYQGAVLADPRRTKPAQRLKEIEERVRQGATPKAAE
jgi:hypothetical protein